MRCGPADVDRDRQVSVTHGAPADPLDLDTTEASTDPDRGREVMLAVTST